MPDTTCHMSISLDGFVAGPDQSREHPLGKRGRELHGWHLGDERANEADETAVGWLMRPRGAYVMGRNMFGPIRGEWEEDWRGWWGPEPPYHAPVFVLTNHAHEPIEMEGGRPSTSSPTASTPPTHGRVRRPATTAWTSRAAPPPFGRRSSPGSSTSSRSTSPRSYSGPASGSSTASDPWGWSPSRCCIRRWPRTSATAGRAEGGDRRPFGATGTGCSRSSASRPAPRCALQALADRGDGSAQHPS